MAQKKMAKALSMSGDLKTYHYIPDIVVVCRTLQRPLLGFIVALRQALSSSDLLAPVAVADLEAL